MFFIYAVLEQGGPSPSPFPLWLLLLLAAAIIAIAVISVLFGHFRRSCPTSARHSDEEEQSGSMESSESSPKAKPGRPAETPGPHSESSAGAREDAQNKKLDNAPLMYLPPITPSFLLPVLIFANAGCPNTYMGTGGGGVGRVDPPNPVRGRVEFCVPLPQGGSKFYQRKITKKAILHYPFMTPRET